MSLDAMRWAFQQTGLRSSVKFVLVALADRANEDNECWPSRDTIAADTCLNPETVSKATEELEALGLIEKHRRFAGSVVFRLVGVEPRHPSAGNPAKGKNPTKGKTRHPSAGNPAPNLPMNLPKTYYARDDDFPALDDIRLTPENTPAATADPPGFEEFWSAYPKKVAKADARKAWRQIKRPAIDVILGDLRTREWPESRFIPNPATYLRGHRWEDERNSAQRGAPKSSRTRSIAEDLTDRSWAT